MNIPKFIQELKRRNVFRVATAYAVSAWLLIQISATIFPFIGISSFWITTIIVVLVIGFPFSLVLGWVFEFTSEGLKKSDEVEITESVTTATSKKLNVVIISVLSVAVLFLLVERIFFAESALIELDTLSAQTASIAVLPFVDMSAENDQEYFSDGLTEELLNVLAKVEELQVAGRTSSFQYKGQNLDLRKIGKALGVEHVLEGSIRKSGNQIRITAQLIKTEDGFHMWSETYDLKYSANDLFKIQDLISQKVLQELEIRLLPEKVAQMVKELTKNIEAYDDYLKATQLLANRKATEIEKAIELFGQAIEKDPDFAAAYARRAIAYNLLNVFGNIDRDEMMSNMRRNIDRALILDGDLGWAYAALGEYHKNADNREEAEIALSKAHMLMPGDPEIMIWYSQAVDSWKLSEQLIKRAYETDPFSALAIYFYAKILYDYDEFEEAFELMEKNLEFNPENSLALSLKAEFMRDQPFGKLDESFILAYQAYQLEPGNLTYKFNLAEISFDMGFFFLVDQMREEIKEVYPENFSLLEVDFDYYLYIEQYDSMQVVLTKVTEYLDLDPSDYDLFEPHMILYLNAGKVEEAKNYIDKNYPDIPKLDFESDKYYVEDLAYSAVVYQKLGIDEIATPLIDLSCELIIGDLEYEGDLKKEIVQDLMDYMDCAALKKDKELLLSILEEIHFERRSIANIYTFIDANPILDFVKEEREFRELRDRMETDIDGMRENAITWMKNNNYWQEGWEIFKPNY